MFDQIHPILLPSAILYLLVTLPSELYRLFFKTHLVHTVLPVYVWVWNHQVGRRRSLWDNILEQTDSVALQPSIINGSSYRHRTCLT